MERSILHLLAAASFFLLAFTAASADMALIITTDPNLNDNGGVDEFTPIPVGGSETVYVWGVSTPSAQTIGEFNFHFVDSGSALSFSTGAIGSLFTGVSGSISDTDISDDQIGWSVFFGTPPSVPTAPMFTLFASFTVTIDPGAIPGADTTVDIAGAFFAMDAPGGADITTTGTSRDITLGCIDNADCNDGVICTEDSCNQGTGSCDNVANHALCDDGTFCNGSETCDAINDCQAGSDPCPGQLCDETGDACVDCLSDSDCDDCNPCTLDSCDPVLSCTHDQRPQLFGDIWDADSDSCGSDGRVDLDDIITMLDAFNGIFACPHPCP